MAVDTSGSMSGSPITQVNLSGSYIYIDTTYLIVAVDISGSMSGSSITQVQLSVFV